MRCAGPPAIRLRVDTWPWRQRESVSTRVAIEAEEVERALRIFSVGARAAWTAHVICNGSNFTVVRLTDSTRSCQPLGLLI